VGPGRGNKRHQRAIGLTRCLMVAGIEVGAAPAREHGGTRRRSPLEARLRRGRGSVQARSGLGSLSGC
jgi:hypothetical protein